jgi:DNA-directed RNA polymerase subunit H (RpoH/RPB5)
MKNKIKVIDHVLVSRHIILSEEEKKQVIKEYGIKRINQFPKILKSDPTAKFLEAKPGDLIRIIRKDYSGKESPYYRIVIDG